MFLDVPSNNYWYQGQRRHSGLSQHYLNEYDGQKPVNNMHKKFGNSFKGNKCARFSDCRVASSVLAHPTDGVIDNNNYEEAT